MQAMSDTAHVFKLFRLKRQTGEEGGGESEVVSQSPPPNYDEGPHPLISGIQSLVIGKLSNSQFFSDSLFSLIIFIYVSITFLYMFYAFCWRSAVNKPMPDTKVDLPMITDMLDQVEAQSNGQEKKDAV